MISFFVSFKLLRKQIWTTLIVIVQIILSLISLSSLVVFIFDNQDNVRAMEELPTKNVSILTLFPYYDMSFAEEKLQNSPLVESIGKVCYTPEAFCSGKECKLVTYDDIIINEYTPSLADGSWLKEDLSQTCVGIPAVVSADMGLQVGDTATISTSTDSNITIFVQGVLKKPTQYLFPDSYADPEYFEADMIISNDSVVIVSAKDIQQLGKTSLLSNIQQTQSCFIFSKEGYADTISSNEINRLGNITPVENLISLYKENTKDLIFSQAIIFFVFLLLAITGVISSNVIQSRQNRRVFTIYYLLGMDWKQGVAIEFLRNSMIVLITVVLCYVLGKIGIFPLYWLNQTRVLIFFVIVILYVGSLFAVVSALFLRKLIHEDISLALKDLHQGE